MSVRRLRIACLYPDSWATVLLSLSTGPGRAPDADRVAGDCGVVESAPGETVTPSLSFQNRRPRSGLHFTLEYGTPLLCLTFPVTTPRCEPFAGSCLRVLGNSLLPEELCEAVLEPDRLEAPNLTREDFSMATTR